MVSPLIMRGFDVRLLKASSRSTGRRPTGDRSGRASHHGPNLLVRCVFERRDELSRRPRALGRRRLLNLVVGLRLLVRDVAAVVAAVRACRCEQ